MDDTAECVSYVIFQRTVLCVRNTVRMLYQI